MKRKLLAMAVLLSSIVGYAQIITFVEEPASLEGGLNFTWGDDASWGAPPLSDPMNAIQDTLAIALDGDPTMDTLACDMVGGIITDVSGKIAVLYRGECNFSDKALNAQNAGAVAVVIINHSGAPVGMNGGTVGPTVTIPVVMIGTQEGAAIYAALQNGETVVMFIGNKQNLFANDLGMYKQHVWLPPSGATSSLLTANPGELNVNLGAWVTNYGSAGQLDVILSASIDENGSNVYQQSSTPVGPLPSGDSVFISLPDFTQASFNGHYEIEYEITSSAAEEYESDNVFNTTMHVDSIFSYAQVDPMTNEPIGSQFFQIAMQQGGFRACNHFRNDNASRVAVTGIYTAATTAADDSLPGQLIEASVYRWDDVFTDLNGTVTFDFVTQVATGEYIYSTDQQREIILIEMDAPVVLEDAVRYLFCAETVDNRIFLGHTGEIDYMVNQDTLLQPIGVLDDIAGNGWNAVGFGTDNVAAVGAVMVPFDVSVQEETELSSAPAFPNPAQTSISIPLTDLNGTGDLRIMDMNGKLVSTQPIVFNGNTLIVDVAEVDNGAYLLHLTTDNGEQQQIRVVVSK